ncbi:hypothetical protein L6Q21_05330 [Sandaracinobacter sp. RS1-74]|uniref:hypothetical protein n=1 Tax=Sandaracinobacteroides sayramensis TaxID=2913411 RepID=UPI001EDAA58A|nr:hypothetical protein [Sandaracinobacteroides sayramensis]MCG2840399.1 hypothetical protein [Sandaracinobacteroides sayramensis]
MTQGRTVFIVLVALVVGFGSGFVLRPILVPVGPTAATAGISASIPAMIEPRGTQYFRAHLDEARHIVEQCQTGAVRGGECATAETAVVEAEGKERFGKFMGN